MTHDDLPRFSFRVSEVVVNLRQRNADQVPVAFRSEPPNTLRVIVEAPRARPGGKTVE